ncbi:RNA-dependent RNA polymerase [Auricularia heimuer mycovirgavirus 1]|nr:RNA-dependent RNA polymerase [Auricularia heimuer mycovirgavirus 1]
MSQSFLENEKIYQNYKNRNSEFGNGAITSQLSDAVTAESQRRSLYQKMQRVSISVYLTTAEKKTLADAYPGVQLDYVSTVYNMHGIANAFRTVEQVTIARSFGKNVRIMDVGGNPVPYFFGLVTNVTLSKPLLCVRDGARWTKQVAILRDALARTYNGNSAAVQTARSHWATNFDAICQNVTAEADTRAADCMLFLHSMYDIEISGVGRAMDNAGASRAVAVLMFDPDIITAPMRGVRHGVIAAQNCRWTIIDKDDTLRIRFFFERDSSLDYEHDYLAYVDIVTRSCITTGVNRYLVEHEHNFGRVILTITRAVHGQSLGDSLSFNYWYTVRRDHVRVPVVEFDKQARVPRLTGCTYRYIDIAEDTMTMATTYAIGVKESERTVESIFKYLRSVSGRTTINGTDVVKSSGLNDKDMYALAQTIWFRSYVMTYGSAKITSMLKTHATSERSLQSAGILTLLTQRVMLPFAPIVGSAEFGLPSVVDRLRDFLAVDVAVQVEKQRMVPLMRNARVEEYVTFEEEVRAIEEFLTDDPDMHLLDEEQQRRIRTERMRDNGDALRALLSATAEVARAHEPESEEHIKAMRTIRVIERDLFKLDNSYVIGTCWSDDEAAERVVDKIAPLPGSAAFDTPVDAAGGALPTACPYIPGDGHCGYHVVGAVVNTDVDLLRITLAGLLRAGVYPGSELEAPEVEGGRGKATVDARHWMTADQMLVLLKHFDRGLSLRVLRDDGSVANTVVWPARRTVYCTHQRNHFFFTEEDWSNTTRSATPRVPLVDTPAADTYETVVADMSRGSHARDEPVQRLAVPPREPVGSRGDRSRTYEWSWFSWLLTGFVGVFGMYWWLRLAIDGVGTVDLTRVGDNLHCWLRGAPAAQCAGDMLAISSPVHTIINSIFGDTTRAYVYLVINPFLGAVSLSGMLQSLVWAVATILLTRVIGWKGDIMLSVVIWYCRWLMAEANVYHTALAIVMSYVYWHYPLPTPTNSMPGQYPDGESVSESRWSDVFSGSEPAPVGMATFDATWRARIRDYYKSKRIEPVLPTAEKRKPMPDVSAQRLNSTPPRLDLPTATAVTKDAEKAPPLYKPDKRRVRQDCVFYDGKHDDGNDGISGTRKAAVQDFYVYTRVAMLALEGEYRSTDAAFVRVGRIPQVVSGIRASRLAGLVKAKAIGPGKYVIEDCTFESVLTVYDPSARRINGIDNNGMACDYDGALIDVGKSYTDDKGTMTLECSATGPYVWVSNDLAECLDLRTLDALADIDLKGCDNRRTYVNEAGVASCGKTFAIAVRAKAGDVILAMTTSSRDELIEKLREFEEKPPVIDGVETPCVRADQVDIRTMASYLLTSEKRRARAGVLHLDEAVMCHAGLVYLLGEICGAHTIFGYGDPQQGIWSPRVDDWPMSVNTQVVWDKRNVTFKAWVTPKDMVCALRHLDVGGYGSAYHTMSKVTKSSRMVKVQSYQHALNILPKVDAFKAAVKQDARAAVILSWTKDTRNRLRSAGYPASACLTVGQCQGGRWKHVYLVRLEAHLPDVLGANPRQNVVACTRHSERFTYVRLDAVKSADLTTATLAYISAIPDVDAEHDNPTTNIAAPDTYTVIAGGFTIEHYEQTRPMATVLKQMLFDKLAGMYDLFIDLARLVSRSTVDGSYDIPNMCQVPTFHTVDFTFVANEAYGLLMPGVRDERRVHDNAVRAYSDISVAMDGYARVNFATTEPLRDHTAFMPNVHTDAEPPRQGSQRDYIHALGKRNMAAYNNRKFRRSGSAEDKLNHALHCWWGPEWKHKLARFQRSPLGFKPEYVADFIAAQTDATVKNMLQEELRIEDFEMGNYQMILKKVCKAADEVGAAMKWSQPQVVVFMKKIINGIFGPIVREAFGRFIENLRPNVRVNKGETVEELQAHANACFTDEDFEFIENDFSAYDKSQDDACLELEMLFLRRLGFPPDLLDMWETGHIFTRIRAFDSGFTLWTMYQRKSGDVTTSFGNTILNMIAVAWCYFKSAVDCWNDVIFAWFLGDDSTLCVRRGKLGKRALGDGAQAMADEFNLAAKVEVHDTGYFCGQYIVRVAAQFFLLCDPVRRLSKFGRYDIRKESEFAEHYTSLIDNLRNYDRQDVLDVGAEQICRRHKGKRPLAGLRLAMWALSSVRQNSESFRRLWSAEVSTVSF